MPISHFLVAAPTRLLKRSKRSNRIRSRSRNAKDFSPDIPHLKGLAADDTAGSVKRVVESGDVTRAAIGGKRTAEIYGGKILREHIEDHAENYTRFALLSPKADEQNKGSKISLVVRLENKPGALHSALRPFVRRGIDLLKIESRPIKDAPSQFNFYFDLQAPANESELRGALEEISEIAVDVRISDVIRQFKEQLEFSSKKVLIINHSLLIFMILILKPNIDADSREFQRIEKHLKNLQNIEMRVHQRAGRGADFDRNLSDRQYGGVVSRRNEKFSGR